MRPIYKLMRPDRTTYGGFLYEPGKLYEFSGHGGLCGPGYSHAYLSPETAVLHNPIHASYAPTILWRCEGTIAVADGEMKVGCTAIRLVEQIELPAPIIEQRVAYAIRCAWSCGSAQWRAWAEGWLSGRDRAAAGARVAEAGAVAASRAAEAGTETPAWAARAAAWASRSAAWAARAAAWAAEVGAETAGGAMAAAGAARAAARGTRWAETVPLVEYARWACSASDPFDWPGRTLPKGA